jgi:hypothetical protein
LRIHPINIHLNQTLCQMPKKSLLTGAWYSYLLRASASAWQIQKWMLTIIHWTKHRVPNERTRESMQGAEGVWSPIGGTSIWTNQYPHSSLELNHQSKKTHSGTRGSSCICSRGWPRLVINGRRSPRSCEGSILQYRGMPGPGMGVGVLGSRGRGDGIRGS